jgi:hypothetical protein
MSIAVQCSSCGHEEEFEQLAADKLSPCPACGKPFLAPAARKPAVFRVSAANVIKSPEPALPRLQTFEELGITDHFRKAVEEELTKDEKLVWLGRPSRNPAVHPDKRVLAVIGLVVLGVAVALGLFVKGMPLIFPGVLGLLGLFFVAAPWLFNPANTYQACYVVTNRRAILLERTLAGPRRKSYHPHELLALERRSNQRVAGAGDLIFEYIFIVGEATNGPATDGTFRRTDVPQRSPRGFFYLDQVQEVEHLIRSTLLKNLEKKLDE